MARLEFSHLHSYASGIEGISIPVALRHGGQIIDLLAHVDTGASHCLFKREQGELLGLDIESGDRMTFSTATGGVSAFGHLVTIETLGLSFESIVYFFADAHISRNVLGRQGWLDRIRFGLVDHDQTLYLAEYDFSSR